MLGTKCFALVAIFLAGCSALGNSTKFKVCDKTPEKAPLDRWRGQSDSSDPNDEFKSLEVYRRNNCTEILQASKRPVASVISQNLGFVNTVVRCYNQHYNLVLRPDDIWAAIMTQFSLYINKNSEEFRKKFVAHEGKKKLIVSVSGSLRSAPYDTLVRLMSAEIHKNLVDPEVKEWVLPAFSTTTDTDLVTVGVVFMAALKNYFSYEFHLTCGIPSITLEGTVEDWKDVYRRLEKLKEYKLQEWYDMLEPILKEFVNAKEDKVDSDFWQRMVHYKTGGSGPSEVSGWITAFCVFDKDGNWQGKVKQWNPWFDQNTRWPTINADNVPKGIVEVDVLVNDNGAKYDTAMFSGHMGAEVKEDQVTLQPVMGWAICLKSKEERK